MLDEFPRILREALTLFSTEEQRRRSASGLFAPVEQAWHVADLEIEGYGARIEQLLRADGAHFLDFAGDVIAEQRHYADLDLESALRRFEAARTLNVARLREATSEQRGRRATQDGVEGFVTLARIEEMMASHDASHANEIIELLREHALTIPDGLAAIASGTDPLRRSA